MARTRFVMAPSDNNFGLPSASRRSFLSLSAAASAAFALRIVTEPMLAHARPHNYPKDAIRIDANENPLGPCASAREAAAAIVPQGGRYSDWLTDDLVKTLADMEGLKPEQVRVDAGSSPPLHHTVAAFTSAQRSYVTADPGYEAGIFTAKAIGAKVVKVPLTKTYAHDVKAMLAAAPDAGVFYVCSPNNPTGTLTSHSDIEYLVENKPKGSVVLVDEAYIHFSDAVSVMDLVRAGKDVVLLRTFSKIYGMAGLRVGYAAAPPELIKRMEPYRNNVISIVSVRAVLAALDLGPKMLEERKAKIVHTRTELCAWLSEKKIDFIPPQANFIMIETGRDARQMQAAMLAKGVAIGRPFPALNHMIRVSIGTDAEMAKFRKVFTDVMTS